MSNWCREKNCYCNNTTDFGYCKTTVCIKSEKTSTVKAIPIEWIEKKLNCCDNINAEIFVKALMREWENREWPQ